jgi:hypothetical protein
MVTGTEIRTVFLGVPYREEFHTEEFPTERSSVQRGVVGLTKSIYSCCCGLLVMLMLLVLLPLIPHEREIMDREGSTQADVAGEGGTSPETSPPIQLLSKPCLLDKYNLATVDCNTTPSPWMSILNTAISPMI